jgi:hypothetical protein
VKLAMTSAMTRASNVFALLASSLWIVAGCVSASSQANRTNGLELEYLWRDSSEDRTAFYVVEQSGAFRSAGGSKAGQRETSFELMLSDSEIARLCELVDAINTAHSSSKNSANDTIRNDARSDDTRRGDARDTRGWRSELMVRSDGARKEVRVSGADPAIEELRAFLSELSMRQYRNVLDALPEPGPRNR